MKIKIPEKRRSEIQSFVSALADTIAQQKATNKERQECRDIGMKANADVLAKEGLVNLSDDKDILAHLIRRERLRLAGQRATWNSTREMREENKFDELHDEAIAYMSGLMNDLIEATVAAISQRLKPTVGEEEANRLARLSQPVRDIEALKLTKFCDYGEPNHRFHALERMLEMLQFILGDEQDDEALKRMLVRFKKATNVPHSLRN